jgi:hypothetical protein
MNPEVDPGVGCQPECPRCGAKLPKPVEANHTASLGFVFNDAQKQAGSDLMQVENFRRNRGSSWQ